MEGLLTQEEAALKVAVKTMKSEWTAGAPSSHHNEALHVGEHRPFDGQSLRGPKN